MTTSVEIDAGVAVAAHLPLVDVPDQLLNLAEVLRRPDPAVAIVGLVSRGKSTLLNKLCGTTVSRPSMRPETASIVTVRSGAPSATGRRADGTVLDLPSEPGAFAQSAQRFGGEGLRWAELSGEFRLPEGLVLIDTPGLDDAAGDLDDDLAHVIDDWRSCGATAAVVVTAFPPGILKRDRELIERASTVFGANVRVVLLTTSPQDVDRSNLQDVAEDAATQFSAPILIVPPDDGAGTWGSGPLGELENQISALSDGAALAHRRARETAGRLLDAMAADITALGRSELPALVSARERQPMELPRNLREAIADTIARHEHERAEAERATRRADTDRRLAILDAAAQRLGPVLLDQRTTASPANRRQAADELRTMAAESSRVAQEQLAVAAGLPSDERRSIGLALSTLVPLLSPELQAEALARSTPGGDEAIALLGLAVSSQVRPVLEFAAVRGARLGLGLADLDLVSRTVTTPGPSVELLKVQVDRLVSEMATVPVDGLSLGGVHSRFAELMNRSAGLRSRLERTGPPQAIAQVLGRLEVGERTLIHDLSRALSNTIEAAVSEPAEDPASWWRSTEGHRFLGRSLLSYEIGAAAPDLPMQLHLFEQHGHSWAQNSAGQVEQAKRKAAQVRANQVALWPWAWGSLALALVLCLASSALGLLSIVGAIALLIWASKRSDPPAWRQHYRPPPTPWQLPEGRVALPVRSL